MLRRGIGWSDPQVSDILVFCEELLKIAKTAAVCSHRRLIFMVREMQEFCLSAASVYKPNPNTEQV